MLGFLLFIRRWLIFCLLIADQTWYVDSRLPKSLSIYMQLLVLLRLPVFVAKYAAIYGWDVHAYHIQGFSIDVLQIGDSFWFWLFGSILYTIQVPLKLISSIDWKHFQDTMDSIKNFVTTPILSPGPLKICKTFLSEQYKESTYLPQFQHQLLY